MKRFVPGLVAIALLAVLLLAGASTAVRLLSAQKEAGEEPPGAMVFEDVFDDGSGSPVTVRTVILPAAELPDRPAEAAGVLVRQEDNGYFVGTGSVSVSIEVINGEESSAVDHSGPEIEVIAGRDTRFYRDVTEVSFTAAESKEQTLQQEVVAVEQPESLPAGTEMQVWGERRGDRVIADVIVFSDKR
jgi:hypothetical protein